jgi:hypothetical protein
VAREEKREEREGGDERRRDLGKEDLGRRSELQVFPAVETLDRPDVTKLPK